ncbi:GntR family transcriptional regulator [Mycobacterium sp. NAZ190054]|uniref:GntR family transcriptional regulator n=1 Tax=Mycobacterium sp. NAZ190054 TaxID=1747766 RepID=UPI00079977D5|nr:GntR family transcriptional regulator [Mycobacterium sp. NAZ190054]KWX68422.1 GntR family transcriptional regulator [Mycobacterium sp. NAZ190054]
MTGHRLESINRYSGQPLYRQLSDVLQMRLTHRAKPGDKLPSEAELSQEFDVNRLTVRRALDELNQRGLIETVRGKGSFVATPRMRYDMSAGRDASFTRTMLEAGHRVAIEVLSTDIAESDEAGAALRTQEPLFVCTTLRLVDDEPWSVSTTSIPTDRFPRLAQQWAGDTSLFDYLLENHGVRMQRASRTFAASLAEPVEAEHLRIRVGSAILEMRGLNVGQDGAPIAAVRHRFRGDHVQFTVDLS